LNRDRFSRQDTPAKEKPEPTEIEARLAGRRLGRDDEAEGGGERRVVSSELHFLDFQDKDRYEIIEKEFSDMKRFNVGRRGLEAKKSDDWEDGSPEVRPPVDQLHRFLFVLILHHFK
jgi:hypothetical protein